ncbi:MAG: molybdopterin molybdotransferase MoeA [Clostridium sp.]|nr:molybdopterin molybdotransferase MoeA [Clostridium sp.]
MKEVTRCTLEDAIRLITNRVKPVMEIEEVELMEALGRVLGEDVTSPHNQPPFPRSPLDGYALQSASSEGATKEHGVVLKVIEEIFAGSVGSKTVKAGEAVRIMTGAPIPEGADCVLRQEDTDYGEDEVEIYQQLKPYDNYCFIGEDYKKGECLLKKGSCLEAPEIGLLASFGRKTVKVTRCPKIHLITTGDELVMPGNPLQPGKIYDSNLYSIGVRLKELGCLATMHNHIEDEAKEVAEQIREASKTADVVITTGGVSVGKKDIIHEVLTILGAEKLFWKIDLKPGTPTLCGMYENTLIIGLSGNPFGAITNLEILVRPVLAYMTGKEKLIPIRKKGVLENDFGKPSKVRRFVRAIYEDGVVRLPQGSHSSGVLSSMRGCNCLIDIPGGSEAVRKGDEVTVCLL